MRVRTLSIIEGSIAVVIVVFVSVSSTAKRCLPRLAQTYVCKTVFVSKRNMQVPICIKRASIQSQIFRECLEDEGALVDGWLGLSRHDCANLDKGSARQRCFFFGFAPLMLDLLVFILLCSFCRCEARRIIPDGR